MLAEGRGEEVDEPEWAACGDPDKMLGFLQGSGNLSERKARLFACAAVRRVWHLLTDERSRRVVEVAERYADGLAAAGELEQAGRGEWAAATLINWIFSKAAPDPAAAKAEAAALFAGHNPLSLDNAATTARAAADAGNGSEPVACALLRDIVGSLPFRSLPPLPSSVRTWNDGIIVKLATSIYEERKLPEGTLDRDRLAVLADALEEAGVTDQDLLGHLRQQGAVHVRGCFLLDWLLEKA